MTEKKIIKKAKMNRNLYVLTSVLFSGLFFFGLMTWDFDNPTNMVQIGALAIFTLINVFFWWKARNNLLLLQDEANWRKKK